MDIEIVKIGFDPKKYYIVLMDPRAVDFKSLDKLPPCDAEMIFLPVMPPAGKSIELCFKTLEFESIAAARAWLDEVEWGKKNVQRP